MNFSISEKQRLLKKLTRNKMNSYEKSRAILIESKEEKKQEEKDLRKKGKETINEFLEEKKAISESFEVVKKNEIKINEAKKILNTPILHNSLHSYKLRREFQESIIEKLQNALNYGFELYNECKQKGDMKDFFEHMECIKILSNETGKLSIIYKNASQTEKADITTILGLHKQGIIEIVSQPLENKKTEVDEELKSAMKEMLLSCRPKVSN